LQNDVLDGDHRLLLELLDTLESLSSSGSSTALQKAVNDLCQLSRRHFATEELLMLETGYANYARHRRAHWLLGEKLGSALAQIGAPRGGSATKCGLGAGDRKAMAALTRKWIVDHILAEDLPMAAALGMASHAPAARSADPRERKLRPVVA
jgi:hemerythrin-like metal-binding protein